MMRGTETPGDVRESSVLVIAPYDFLTLFLSFSFLVHISPDWVCP